MDQTDQITRQTGLDSRLPQKLCGLFGCHRIDVEACAPFKAGHVGQFRNDVDVLVVEISGLLVEGRTMEDNGAG